MNEPGKATFGQESEDLAARYVGVEMTQGAVEVDADFNESTWKPPPMYAYVDGSGKVVAVDQSGSPLPSPPTLSLVDPASGTSLGNRAVDPWGNAVPLYQPPIGGVQAYVGADGSVRAVDASGTPVVSPPVLSFVDPKDGSTLAEPLVLDPFTHQALIGEDGMPVTVSVYSPPIGGVQAYVGADGSVRAVDASGTPVVSPPVLSFVDPKDGSTLAEPLVLDPFTHQALIGEDGMPVTVSVYSPPIGGVQAYVGADGSVKAVDASGTPVVSPPVLSFVDPKDGSTLAEPLVLDPFTHQALIGEDGMPVTVSVYSPPIGGVQAYVGADGSVKAVDASGTPVVSPPVLSFVDPKDGSTLAEPLVLDPFTHQALIGEDGMPVTVSVYSPPIGGVQAYVGADGSVKAVDANGNPLACPPHLSAVDPASGGPLAQPIVLDSLTHQPLLDSNGDPVTIPTLWPPPGPPPATWPPTEEDTGLGEEVPETALGDDAMIVEDQEETLRSDIPTVEAGIVETAFGEDEPPEAVGALADEEAISVVEEEEFVSVTGLGSEELDGVLAGGATAIPPGIGEVGPVRGFEAEVVELSEEIPELKWEPGLAAEDLSHSQDEYVKAEIEEADITGEEPIRFGVETVKAGIEAELIGEQSAVLQGTEFTVEVVEAGSLQDEHGLGRIQEGDALVDEPALPDREPSAAEEGFEDDGEIDI